MSTSTPPPGHPGPSTHGTPARTTPVRPTGWRPTGAVPGVLHEGRRALAVAAQASVDEQGALLHEGDAPAQLALALGNVLAVVDAAGMPATSLVQLTVLALDRAAAEDGLDVVTDHLDALGCQVEPTCREVTALPVPGMLVALEALAIT